MVVLKLNCFAETAEVVSQVRHFVSGNLDIIGLGGLDIGCLSLLRALNL